MSTDANSSASAPRVAHFREITLWPVQLMPMHEGVQIQRHWKYLNDPASPALWKEVVDGFTDDPSRFDECHYKEFVTFLPYVQRFLYGEGANAGIDPESTRSRLRLFRRYDVAQARISFPGDEQMHTFEVARVELCFFHDIDVAILAVEISAQDLPLTTALDTLYRLGRAYPTHWEHGGRGGHCAERVEWLSADGRVLAVSDYEDRNRYLSFVSRYRVPCVAAHWEYLVRPLVLDHSDQRGILRYREIESQRMPSLSYLALDDVTRLTRGDLVRLGLVMRPGDSQTLPCSERFLQDFEFRYCYDRHWDERAAHAGESTRFMCNGQAFTVLGNAADPFFVDPDNGMLGQFRHQYFLLCLIAHLHKAALLMLSDRLVVALNRLDIRRPDSIRAFKRSIRQTSEILLRFTHRYWFHAVSDQAQARDLFKMWSMHLNTDDLYDEVRQEIQDMAHYLDSDSLRRQADTVVRLTVVTTFGLIGTVATGFLGMNLIAAADQPLWTKVFYFLLVFIPTTVLTLYTVVKSKRLSEFLEALSDERLTRQDKLDILVSVWKRRKRG